MTPNSIMKRFMALAAFTPLALIPQAQGQIPNPAQQNPSSPIPPFLRAEHPREWSFPRDHAPHPEFQTEWWYITGNLETIPTQNQTSQPLGFQFTVFRRGLAPIIHGQPPAPRTSAWATNQVYLLHLGLADLNREKFWHHSMTRRPVLGQAGAAEDTLHVFVEQSSLKLQNDGLWKVQGRTPEFAYELLLQPTRPPLFHGPGGRDPKGPEPGQASYYYSMTRLQTQGWVQLGDSSTSQPVQGISWMDHEFMTSTLAPGQTGWDWFCAMLDDGSDLMIYRLRLENGGVEPMSGGTLRRDDGTTVKITAQDMTIKPLETWRSPKTRARYPIKWQITVPKLQLNLTATSRAKNQEMVDDGTMGFSYYEAATAYEGTLENRPVQGLGYMELTGYQGSVEQAF